MNNEFFDALLLIEKEKGISADYLLGKIQTAIALAVKKDFGGIERVNVDIDPESRRFRVTMMKTVVEEVVDPANEILVDEAMRYSKHPIVGEPVEIKLETKQLGRIAAQAAKHVIRQGIREAERSQLLDQFNSKLHEIVTGLVQKVEPGSGNATIEIDRSEVLLFKNDQIPGEVLKEGDRIKVYVSDVVLSERRYGLKISRTHRNLVKRLFEMEVPEIFDGTVEVKSISREAGSRTKIAVWSKDENVDPIGACIGPKGNRVNEIIKEINGEKIDVIKYSEDPAEFISAALAPANVIQVNILDEQEKSARVIVPDHQLSLAIGNKGQNAKLAARLTGYKIDIRPESGFYGEDDPVSTNADTSSETE